MSPVAKTPSQYAGKVVVADHAAGESTTIPTERVENEIDAIVARASQATRAAR